MTSWQTNLCCPLKDKSSPTNSNLKLAWFFTQTFVNSIIAFPTHCCRNVRWQRQLRLRLQHECDERPLSIPLSLNSLPISNGFSFSTNCDISSLIPMLGRQNFLLLDRIFYNNVVKKHCYLIGIMSRALAEKAAWNLPCTTEKPFHFVSSTLAQPEINLR